MAPSDLACLGATPYGYNSSNELTSAGSKIYRYDANGNTLSKAAPDGVTSYTWDFENRLASVTLPGAGGTVTFKYDPFGRRIQKSAGLAVTNYAYDGDNAIEELNVTGAVTAQYTQGLGIDEPLATYRSGVASFYHADGLGSIQALTDATGIPAAVRVPQRLFAISSEARAMRSMMLTCAGRTARFLKLECPKLNRAEASRRLPVDGMLREIVFDFRSTEMATVFRWLQEDERP